MGLLFSWINDFWAQEMEISILGLQNAGKSSFCHVLQHGEFEENMLPTVGFNMRKINRQGVCIKTWDMGGQAQFRGMWQRYCRDVTVILFMIDASDIDSVEFATESLESLLGHPELNRIPLLILLNKIDLVPMDDREAQKNEILDILHYNDIEEREKAVFCISCKQLTGIDQTLEWLIKQSQR